MFPRFMIVYGTDHFRQKLETVTSFKCLVSVTTDEGSKPEILSRIEQILTSGNDKAETSLE